MAGIYVIYHLWKSIEHVLGRTYWGAKLCFFLILLLVLNNVAS
jgi:hypothetical protein